MMQPRRSLSHSVQRDQTTRREKVVEAKWGRREAQGGSSPLSASFPLPSFHSLHFTSFVFRVRAHEQAQRKLKRTWRAASGGGRDRQEREREKQKKQAIRKQSPSQFARRAPSLSLFSLSFSFFSLSTTIPLVAFFFFVLPCVLSICASHCVLRALTAVAAHRRPCGSSCIACLVSGSLSRRRLDALVRALWSTRALCTTAKPFHDHRQSLQGHKKDEQRRESESNDEAGDG